MQSRTVDGLFRAAASAHRERAMFDCVADASAVQAGIVAAGATSYGEVACILDAINEQLELHGLVRGDRAIFYLEEPVASTLFNLACAHRGIVPVPLAPSFSGKALGQLALRVEAKVVFTDAAHADDAVGVIPVLGFAAPGATYIAIDPRPRRPFDDAIAQLERGAQHTASDCYLFQPSSGTTGEPKLIMRSHAVFDRVARVHALSIAETGPHRCLLVAALTHGMGQYALATALHLGGTLCITSEIDTHTPLPEVLALAPDLLWLTPRVLRSLLEQRKTQEPKWLGTHARVLFIGGAATEPALLRDLHGSGLCVSEGYGASEISLLSITRAGGWREGTSGQVIDDVTLEIADDGELLARSPNGVMIGYFGDEALTAQAFTPDGFYRTGDYCDVDADHYLHYRGRKRDVFNTNEGANIHPARIETQLEALPDVKQAILVGDQRPYLTALLVIENDDPTGEPDGWTTGSPVLRARVQAGIDAINRDLEALEHVRAFALFVRPFADDVYKIVGHAKVSRNRRVIAERYNARIEQLYLGGDVPVPPPAA